jgi:hypothetical protein
MQGENTGEPFTIDIKIMRRRIRAIGKNKSIGPDRVSGEILKLGGEAMILYLERLLDVTMNNGTLPGDWKRAMVVPIVSGKPIDPIFRFKWSKKNVNEVFILVGCYAVQIGSYRRFGTIYRSHLHWPSLKMGPIDCPFIQ